MDTAGTLEALRQADLTRLGFQDDDARDLRNLIGTLPHEPERLQQVTRVATDLAANIGDYFATAPVSDGTGPRAIADGIVTLLALVAVADRVHANYVARGIDPDLAWDSLADLGQQALVFRRIFGFLGLCSQAWCAQNFTGRLLWLGRLQYTLERDQDGTFVDVHIPETGPLSPELVDASLSQAARILPSAFPGFALERVRLHSWIMDPGLLTSLAPTSNLARFANRFELAGDPEPGTRDLLFFGFRIEPLLEPVDLSALPGNTALRRAMRERLLADEAVLRYGYLRKWPIP